jgi:signal transduction histidine kinase
MSVSLRVLLLEDDEAFEGLIAATLRSNGLSCDLTRVEARDEFVRQLDQETFDLILADCVLPSFDGLSALDMVRGRYPQMPFILVSGVMGEEFAIECLQRGATDYVVKQRLTRLPHAVRRALTEAQERDEKQELEIQLRHSQKMESIGQLAEGVAHDFGNILAIIHGEMELLSMEEDLSPVVTKAIRNVLHCAEQGANLTRQLLTFGRRDTLQRGDLDLNPIVDNFVRMIEPLLGSRIRVRHELAGKLPIVQADAGMIEQVLLNLVINARDAMPRGGEIRCKTEVLSVDAGSMRTPHLMASTGTVVCLRVRDTGKGIPPDVVPKVFDPFFTTKEVGKGSGLGLATVYGIVKQHNGWIDVHSRVGEGTEFCIFLPAATQTAHATGEEPVGRMPAGTETILLVEDDEQLRALIRNVLEGSGYTVLERSSGGEALRTWKESQSQISLLLTDIALPDNLTGWDLAEAFLLEKPALKVIYMSSYAPLKVGRDVKVEEGYNFLRKPFRLPNLVQTVRNALDRVGAPLKR